jgi:hypothetical protein
MFQMKFQQAHEVCKGQNETIMLPIYLSLIYCYESLNFENEVETLK